MKETPDEPVTRIVMQFLPFAPRAMNAGRCARMFLLMLCLSASSLAGSTMQDFQALRAQAASWLEQEAARSFTGAQAQVKVGPVDERLRLPACAQPRFFLPAGARLWASGSLGVRCAGSADWSLYLGYDSQLRGPGLVAGRPLPARHLVAAGDVELGIVEYEQSPNLYPRELPAAARLARPLAAGQALLIDMFLQANVIQAGKTVQVRAGGAGFDVSQEGVALNSAAPGETVKARMPSGRIVRGTATRDGAVAVTP
jgi:flagella basal body P-ring formation protein FlgA